MSPWLHRLDENGSCQGGRVPANTLDDSAVEPRHLDLIQHVPEPSSLVQSGVPSMVDWMAVVPACLRYHYRLMVPTPRPQKHFRQRRASGVRVVVYPNDINVDGRDNCVRGLELPLPDSCDRVIGEDANVGMMIAGHLCHGDRHSDSFIACHSRHHGVERGLIDWTKPELLEAIHRQGLFGGNAGATGRILIAVVMRKVPDRLNPRIFRRDQTLDDVIARNKAVSNRAKSMVTYDPIVIGHSGVYCVSSRDQEVVPAAMDQAALEASHDRATEAPLWLERKHRL